MKKAILIFMGLSFAASVGFAGGSDENCAAKKSGHILESTAYAKSDSTNVKKSRKSSGSDGIAEKRSKR